MTFSADNREGGCNKPFSENMLRKKPSEEQGLMTLLHSLLLPIAHCEVFYSFISFTYASRV